MDTEEILNFADRLVFAKTGKHLDNVQEAILRGAWQDRKYSQISEEAHCSEGHARDVASELWKILSDVLGEPINKSNFKSTLKRLHISIVSSTVEKNSVQIGSVNVCGDTSHSPEVPKSRSPSPPENTQPEIRQDLTDAPDIASFFYDRTSELATLQKWIIQERCRIVAILGISGIGKTAIALHILPQIQHQIVAAAIQELFSSRVAEFLKYDMLFLGEELKAILQQQFDRLSELEKQVMFCIANEIDAVSISQILEKAQLSPAELFDAMQSLGRRGLIEKLSEGDLTLFSLSPVVRQYAKVDRQPSNSIDRSDTS